MLWFRPYPVTARDRVSTLASTFSSLSSHLLFLNTKKPRRAYTWDKWASALWAECLDSFTISLWGSGPTHRGFATARGC